MNVEHLIDTAFNVPYEGAKDYDQFLFHSKFLYSDPIEQVMHPDQEARHGISTRDVDNRGNLAFLS